MENENKRNNFKATRIQLESSESKKILRRVILLLFLVAITFSLRFLDRLFLFITIPPNIHTALNVLTYAFGSLLIATLVIRLTEKSVFRFFAVDKEEWEQKILITKAYAAFVYAIALTVPLVKLGLGLENITLFLGLFATGLALAIRDIIVSYISWYIILNKKPFRIGDFISLDNYSGLVKRIGVFYVTLEQMDLTEYVKIPTNVLFSKLIHNHGQGRVSMTQRFPIYTIPKDFEDRVGKTKAVIMEITGEKNPDRIRMVPNSDGEKTYLEVFFFIPWLKINQKGPLSAKIYDMNRDFLYASKAMMWQEHSEKHENGKSFSSAKSAVADEHSIS